MRAFVLIAMSLAACVEDSEYDEDEIGLADDAVISKVMQKDIPYSPGPSMTLGYPCIEVPLAVPYQCVAWTTDTVTEVEQAVTSCETSPTSACWKIVPEVVNCTAAPNLGLELENMPTSGNTYILHMQCVSL